MNALRLLLLAALTSTTLHAALPGGDALGGLITDNFDENADAFVDRDEWLSGIGDSFSTIDASGDNAIVPDEVDGLRKDIATQTGDGTATLIVAIIKQLILLLDTDKNQSVSREEYEALGGGIFDKLDANKDGKLTRTELAALPVKLLVQ
jgi:EF hand